MDEIRKSNRTMILIDVNAANVNLVLFVSKLLFSVYGEELIPTFESSTKVYSLVIFSCFMPLKRSAKHFCFLKRECRR